MEEQEPSTKAQKETSTSEGKTTDFIPQPEIVTVIILFLQARDVCSLGRCSQALHSVCNSDYVWKELYKRRWPQQFITSRELLESCIDAQSSSHASLPSVHSEGWKAQYIKTHVETTSKISGSLSFVDREIMGKYLGFSKFLDAVNLLKSMELNFEDVCSVLFSNKLSVLANLIGLHYSVNFLHVKDVRDAVVSRGVAERQVRLKWFRKAMYFDMLRMPEQRCYLTSSIGTIAMDKEVLALLSRGPTTNIHKIRIGTFPDQGVNWTT